MSATTSYNPMTTVRWNFDKKLIFFDKKKKHAVIFDNDLLAIETFIVSNVRAGDVLSVGAGPTHFHYMSAMPSKISQIDALEISPANIRVLEEFYASLGSKKTSNKTKIVGESDLTTLYNVIDAFNHQFRKKSTNAYSEGLQLKNRCTSRGQLSVINGDMHELRSLIHKKYSNIIFLFSLYCTSTSQSVRLLHNVRNALLPGGRVLIADFEQFLQDKKQVREEFGEDEVVMKSYDKTIEYTQEKLLSHLLKAGFSKKRIIFKKRRASTPGEEKENKFTYLFAYAEK